MAFLNHPDCHKHCQNCQTAIGLAKIAISVTLSMLVSYIFSYFKIKFVILDGFFKITQTAISIAKISISVTLPMLLSFFFSYLRYRLWYSMAFLKSPIVK